MDKERLDRQFSFLREIDKEKEIFRQNYLADGSRHENDSEHAWHMALMTILLSEYANEEIDVLHTVTMLLLHDLVEIDAGDTYCYDETGKATQEARELVAAERIFGLLPEDQGKKLRAAWDEFEHGDTPEARFARSMDRIQPIMLNAGNGISWREHKIKRSQIMKRNEFTHCGSEILWDYARETFLDPNFPVEDPFGEEKDLT